jgi:hypothetical protein
MATGQGTVVIDFGAFPGSQEASVAFTDATISAGSKVEAYVMADGAAGTHTPNDHRYLPLYAAFTAAPIAGVGGTIYGRARHALIGQYQLRYVFAD